MCPQNHVASFHDYCKLHLLVCKIKIKCMKNTRTEHCQVGVFINKMPDFKENFSHRMIKQFDSPMGRHIFCRKMGTMEPVFANIRNALGLDRFTLRRKKKVNIQWNFHCLVHNIVKIAMFGTLGIEKTEQKNKKLNAKGKKIC